MGTLKHCILILFFSILTLLGRAQYGYSPLVDSLMNLITDSSLSLLDRQLSGDTSVFIGGNLDTIKTRHSSRAGNAKAAQFILEKFQSFGLNARIQNYDPNGQNVIATIPGQVEPDKEFIICAHYDNMPNLAIAPGADDNASGTCAVIEAARILSSQDFDYTIRFIAFDEEEQGLIGSKAYADSAFVAGHQIQGVLNLDMIAWDSDGDNELELSSDTSSISMQVFADYIDLLRLYQPDLSPHLTDMGSSDHRSFQLKGYPAILAIEVYYGDFNSYYHTVNDKFSILNRPYFLSMARGAFSALTSMAKSYKMNLSHAPLHSELNTSPRLSQLVIQSNKGIGVGTALPRMYFKVDDGGFEFVNPSLTSNDTCIFFFPTLETGSKISYYFAVQDSAGEYVCTLPEGGKGVNPPGLIPPEEYFSFYVLNDTSQQFCASALPFTIPANQTKLKALAISEVGVILDMDVKISISHPYTMYLKIFLISPNGTEVELSTRNGYFSANYTNTVFDDEAIELIHQKRAPFSGTFRPESPLSILDDSLMNGTWYLKIVNMTGSGGTLTNFCITARYCNTNFYVDSSRPASGNGRSWATAFKTISEATALTPGPGTVTFIKPGTYKENVMITSNGLNIIPLTTSVEVGDLNKVTFKTPQNLSLIDLVNNQGEYYTYVFRSHCGNNGFYRITEVNDVADYLRVQGSPFMPEEGVNGDTTLLTVAVGQPVIYSRYSPGNDTSHATLDLDTVSFSNSAIYFGDTIGGGEFDAYPSNYNIMEGFEVKNVSPGKGIQVQSSNFNVINQCVIHDIDGIGVYINGNNVRPAKYNLICNNSIYNTQDQGICVGAGEYPQNNNFALFNHILSNDIYTQDQFNPSNNVSAIDLCEYNYGTVVESNLVRDIDIQADGQGALEIWSEHAFALINANTFRNITTGTSGNASVIRIYPDNHDLEILNNLIYNDEIENDNIYAFMIDGTSHNSCILAHNTVFRLNNGFHFTDSGLQPDFQIRNNILSVTGNYFTSLGITGRFILSHNLYFDDPVPGSGMPYYSEAGRQVGDACFADTTAGDFSLTVSSDKAICNAFVFEPVFGYDLAGESRSDVFPDIGAFELKNKAIWIGDWNYDWNSIQNWSPQFIPISSSNVVIKTNSNNPQLSHGDVVVKGLALKQGTQLVIISPASMTITE